MKLYRIVHRSIACMLYKEPLMGCCQHSKLPYIRAFDSIAMAVLDHPVRDHLQKLSNNFRIIQYNLPANAVQLIQEPRQSFYENRTVGAPRFGDWAWRFLIKSPALVAQVPSMGWRWGSVYVINPKHPEYEHVIIKEIRTELA